MRHLARSGSSREKAIYIVPERKVRRLSYAPPRTLHLVDIENLMCGPTAGAMAIAAAMASYKEAVPIGQNDHVIVAANPNIVVDVRCAFPCALLRVGYGKDGADLALLKEIDEVDWVARRYDRVIIGSGDGIFAESARSLRYLGLAVGVVGVRGRVARDLARNAHLLRYIDSIASDTEAA